MHRSGMTLFEVMISVLILASASIVAMMAIPTATRIQQRARAEILASAAFQLALSRLHQPFNPNWGSEGRTAADRPWMNARTWGADMDGFRLSAGGWRQVPESIARRLDSDDSEIARHVAEGGQLWYQPGDNAYRNLVFAIVGLPQQEVMRSLPQMRWPYYDYLTMRYLKGAIDENRPYQEIWADSRTPVIGDGLNPGTTATSGWNAPQGDAWDGWRYGIGFDGAVIRKFADDSGAGDDFYRDAIHEPWEILQGNPSARTASPYMTVTMAQWTVAPVNGIAAEWTLANLNADTVVDWQELSRRKLERALDYLLAGAPGAYPSAPASLPALDAFIASLASANDLQGRSGPLTVAALGARYQVATDRFVVLANVLRYYAYVCGVGSTERTRAIGMIGQPFPMVGEPLILRFQQAHAAALHVNRYLQLHRPYDLRTVRDITHPLMTDHLLAQHDLWGAPLADPAANPGRINHAWDYLLGSELRAFRPESFSLPKTAANEAWTIPGGWFDGGSAQKRTLTWTPKPNQPVHAGAGNADPAAMRTSLSGSPPTDALHLRWNLTNRFAASERCRMFVAWQVAWQDYEDFEHLPGAPLEAATLMVQFHDNETDTPANHWTGFQPGNVRRQEVPSWEVYHPDAPRGFEADPANAGGSSNVTYKYAGDMTGLNLTRYFMFWGADRNNNDRFDNGTVPAASRLRALTVARYHFYDPRGQVVLP